MLSVRICKEAKDLERIAIINVETFKAKISVVETEENGFFRVVDQEVEEIDMCLQPDSDMFLTKLQIDKAIKALRNLRRICEMYHVNKTIAFATFAGGDEKPKNIHSFFEEVFNTCGLRFSVMNNADQNDLLYSGIVNTMDVPKGIICHITSQAIHLIYYNRRLVIAEKVLPFGPLSLVEEFNLDAEHKDENIEKIQQKVQAELDNVALFTKLEGDFELVGSGDYFVDIANIAKKIKKYPIDVINGYRMSLEDSSKVFNQIKLADIDKTRKIKGTSEARADVFVASMIIANTIMQKVGKTEAVIASRNFVEGVMFDNVIDLAKEKPLSDAMGFSMQSQVAFYDKENLKHNEQVYELSLLLYKQLRVLHKLPRFYTKVLRLAAYMHGCGERVSFPKTSKNGYNVLLGSDIYGVSHRELLLAAITIALHTGCEFSVSDYIRFKDIITEEDIDAIKKLGVVVRIADCLDRLRNSVIVDINCDVLGDSVIMKTISMGDSSYEIVKANEVCKEFERQFNKKIEVL